MQPNRFLESKPNPKKPNLFLKAELTADRTPAKEPILWKREGEVLTNPGNPLANLTTVKAKKIPETLGRTCVESMLCKVHPELYIPPLTQPIRNAPDLCHFKRLGLLFCLRDAGLWPDAVIWSDLVVWFGSWSRSVLMVWFGGRVWRWSVVVLGCGGLISDLIVWSGGLLDWLHGLILRSAWGR